MFKKKFSFTLWRSTVREIKIYNFELVEKVKAEIEAKIETKKATNVFDYSMSVLNQGLDTALFQAF
jgi:hypothetical protein